MSRPRSRSERTLVRISLSSRLEQQCIGRAYELALPLVQRCLAGVLPTARSARPTPSPRQTRPLVRLRSVPIPQQRVGG